MIYLLKINVRLNLSQLMNVDRYQKQNQPKLISVAANRYMKYLRNRFIANSSRSSQWPRLEESTVQRKERRGIADNPEWILREYDVLLNAIGIKIVGKRTFVGFVRDRKHPRGKSVFQLVRIHGRGEGQKVRKAMGLPNRSTMKRMIDDIRKEYNKKIRNARRTT